MKNAKAYSDYPERRNTRSTRSTRSNKISKILSLVVTLFLVFSTLICFSIILESTFGEEPPKLFGYRFFYIVSGSMEPTIPIKSLVVVRAQKTYEEGDIITFSSEASAIRGEANTHRIYEVLYDSAQNVSGFITKGDANSAVDADPVALSAVYGKVVYQFDANRAITSFLTFATNRNGFFLLIIIPIVLITIAVLKDFLEARRKMMVEKLKQQIEEESKQENSPKEEPRKK